MKAGTELTAENRKLVEAALEKYPYFSLGRMMLAKLATHLKDEHAAYYRFLGSLYAPSRQHYAFFLEEKLRPRVASPPRLGAAMGREPQASSSSSAPSREEEPSADESGSESMPFSSAFWPPLQGWIAAHRILYKGLTPKIIAQLHRYAESLYSSAPSAPQVIEAEASAVPAAVEPEIPSSPSSEEPSVVEAQLPAPQEPVKTFVPQLEAAPKEESIEPPPSVVSDEAEVTASLSANLPPNSISIAEEKVEQVSSTPLETEQKRIQDIDETTFELGRVMFPKEKESELPLPPLLVWTLLQFELPAGKGLASPLPEKAPAPSETPSVPTELASAVSEQVQPTVQIALAEEKSPSAEAEVVAASIQTQAPEPSAPESTGGLHRQDIPLEETMASVHLTSGGSGAVPESSPLSSAEPPTGGLLRAYIPLEHPERSIHLTAEVSSPQEGTPPVQLQGQPQAPSSAEPPTGGLLGKYIPLEETMRSLAASTEKPTSPSTEEASSGGLLRRYIPLEETIASLEAERHHLSSTPIQAETPAVALGPPSAPTEAASPAESLVGESSLRQFVPLETNDTGSIHLLVPKESQKTDISAVFPEGWRSFLKELEVDASASPPKSATFSQELEHIRRQFIKKLLEERAIRPHVPPVPLQPTLIDRVIEKLQTFPRSGSAVVESEVPELSAPVRENIPTAPRIYTETMAKLYWSQGDLSRAIQIYEALIAKNPAKAQYYREQIAKIQAGEMP